VKSIDANHAPFKFFPLVLVVEFVTRYKAIWFVMSESLGSVNKSFEGVNLSAILYPL
jgi:hypothetical protein